MSTSLRMEKAGPGHLKEIVAIINAGATRARAGREFDDWQAYRPAFDALCAAPEADIYVALEVQRPQAAQEFREAETELVVGTYQIHFLKGLAFRGRPRVELESVHVCASRQGAGIGRFMMAHAEDLARAAGACLIQLTSNREREGSHAFYRRLGFDQSHLGYKKMLIEQPI